MVENKDAPCTVVVEMPSGRKLELTMIRVIEGYTAVFTPTELGEHKFHVTYAESYIPGSPFTIMVEVVIEMTKVLVRGLESRKYGENTFAAASLIETIDPRIQTIQRLMLAPYSVLLAVYFPHFIFQPSLQIRY